MRRALTLGLCAVLAFALVSSGTATAAGFSTEDAAMALDPAASLEDRIRAMARLGESEDPDAARPLLEILTNPTDAEGARSSSARALAKLGKPRDEILAALRQVYEEPTARENLLYTILMVLGDMRAVELLDLLESALQSPDDMIRFKAVQALGELDDEAANRLLLEHLASEKDRIVRAETVRALGRNEGLVAEKALVRALRSDPEPLVRWNAALALRKFGSLSAETRAALAEAAHDASPMVRRAAEGGNP